jgi:hypothetical protein
MNNVENIMIKEMWDNTIEVYYFHEPQSDPDFPAG